MPIYRTIHDGFCSHRDDDLKDQILLFKFDEEYQVLISEDKRSIKFYLCTNDSSFVSYIYIDSQSKTLLNFFKIKNGKRGIGKIFFNWVIDFVRNHNCYEGKSHPRCYKMYHLEKIKLYTNEFLNKTVLKIYQEKGF